MTISDIISLDERYYREYTNEIVESIAGKIYIFALITKLPNSLVEMLIQPKIHDNQLSISNNPIPVIKYLSNEIDTYTIDFADNIYDTMIRLVKTSLDNEVTITNPSTQKTVKLNSNNGYYSFDNPGTVFKGKLSVKVSKGNGAILEFLFPQKDFEISSNKELNKYKLKKPIIIKFDQNQKDKNIKIKINSESKNKFGFSFFTYFSKNNYTPSPIEIKDYSINYASSYEFNIYNPNVELEQEESFCLIIYIDRTLLSNDFISFNKVDIEEITLNDTFDETIIINKTHNIKYVLKIETEKYVYFFQSNEAGFMHYEQDIPCPSYLCVLQKDVFNHNNKIYLNYFNNADKNVIIKIKSVDNFNGYILATASDIKMMQPITKNLMIISEANVDYIYYFKGFDISTKVLFTEYNPTMQISDIVNINENYFKEIELNKFIEKQKDKIYIFVAKTDVPGAFLDFMIQPKIGNDKIEIDSNNEPSIMYFSKDVDEYTLDFSNNEYDMIIQLSKSTLDSEITIINSGEETKLSFNNSYYSFSNLNTIFNGKLNIKVTKGDEAAITFLYAPKYNYTLEDKEYSEYKLTKSPIIKFSKNTKNKNIQITLSSENGNTFDYSFLTFYSKNNYLPIPFENMEANIKGQKKYELTIFNPKEDLEEDETFSLLIYIDKNTLDTEGILMSKVEEKEEEEKEEEEKKEKSGLKDWEIALIVVSCTIAVAIAGVLIWKFVILKKPKIVSENNTGSLFVHNIKGKSEDLNLQN